MDPAIIVFAVLVAALLALLVANPVARVVVRSLTNPRQQSEIGINSLTPVANGGITPFFKLIFLTVAGITLLCLVLAVLLPTIAPKTDADSIKNLWTIVNTGVGAIVGLLGGKSI
jgi:hypothetical protein